MVDFGIVYILKNKCMPGLYKIGLTRGCVIDRIKSLRSTSLPVDFEVVKIFESEHCMQLERHIHKNLLDNRVSGDREFFYAHNDEVIVSLFEKHKRSFRPKPYSNKEKRIVDLHKNTGEITPLKRAKKLGAPSLKWVAERWGSTTANLGYLFRNRPHKFDIIVAGTVALDQKADKAG